MTAALCNTFAIEPVNTLKEGVWTEEHFGNQLAPVGCKLDAKDAAWFNTCLAACSCRSDDAKLATKAIVLVRKTLCNTAAVEPMNTLMEAIGSRRWLADSLDLKGQSCTHRSKLTAKDTTWFNVS